MSELRLRGCRAFILPGDFDETYEKTFLDLYGIANASHIYLIKDSRMFKSGFPYMASKIGNVKFEIIEIED